MSENSFLDKYCTNLTKKGEENSLPPVFYRNQEIKDLRLILSRKKKNNPLLIGGSGVGKTSIIYGMIKQNFSKEVYVRNKYQQIFSLKMSEVLSSSNSEGGVITVFNELIKELSRRDNILFVENFKDLFHQIKQDQKGVLTHTIFSMLYDKIISREITLISCASYADWKQLNEYKDIINSVMSMNHVRDFDKDLTIELLRQSLYKYEEFHTVYYTDEAILMSYYLARKYLSGLSNLSHAIDLLDESAIYCKFDYYRYSKNIAELFTKVKELKDKKNQSVKDQQYDKAADLRDEESKIMRKIDSAIIEWEENQRTTRLYVVSDTVHQHFCEKFNIKYSPIDIDDINTLTEDDNSFHNILENAYDEYNIQQTINYAIIDKVIISLGFNNKEIFIRNLKSSIGDNRISDVIFLLIKFFQRVDSQKMIDLVIKTNARLKEVESRISMGIISDQDSLLEKNKINHSLLNLVNKI